MFSQPKKQTQTNPILSAVGGFRKAKIAYQKIRPHPHPLRFNCALYKKSLIWHYGTVNMKESVS